MGQVTILKIVVTHPVLYNNDKRMKILLIATVFVAGVLGVPTKRESCPNYNEFSQWFQTKFGSQVPDGILTCLDENNYSAFPFQTFNQFKTWFKSATELNFVILMRNMKKVSTDVSTSIEAVLLEMLQCNTSEMGSEPVLMKN